MSSISSQELAASASDSNEPECEPSRSARSTQKLEPSSPSIGPESPVTPMYESSPPAASQQTAFPWMSSAEASHARTSALQGRALALPASALAYGLSTPELLANFDPDSSSWKTSQRCLVEGWTPFSEAWPRSGTMRNGTAYQLPPLVPLTEETASGLWPTPVTMYTRENWTAEDLAAKQSEVKAATEAKGKHHTGNGFGLNLAQAARLWPTPRANDSQKRGNIANDPRNGLPAAVKYWPTTTTRDWKGGSAEACRNVPANGLLGRVVHQFPTPTANRRDGLQSHGRNVVSGSLNPLWVEWLMGFPAGWTALSNLAIPSSRKSRKSSGEQS